MSNSDNKRSANDERDVTETRIENHSSVPNDLPDSDKDRQELRSERTTIDLPDVKDIPGQEFINPVALGEMADTTISSDDEEGKGLFDDEESDEVAPSGDNVSLGEKRILNDSYYIPTSDEDNLRNAALDNTDFQGEPLNEGSFGDERSGKDLDTMNDD